MENPSYWQMVMAVLTANVLTASFIYGMVRASKIIQGDRVPFEVAAAILAPMAFIGIGAYLFGG